MSCLAYPRDDDVRACTTPLSLERSQFFSREKPFVSSFSAHTHARTQTSRAAPSKSLLALSYISVSRRSPAAPCFCFPILFFISLSLPPSRSFLSPFPARFSSRISSSSSSSSSGIVVSAHHYIYNLFLFLFHSPLAAASSSYRLLPPFISRFFASGASEGESKINPRRIVCLNNRSVPANFSSRAHVCVCV